jgi:hypothetical protein
MNKPKVTRTFGPIHFEDLDPHRFEDLVRELIYDFKDWQSIEATGRSGSDEGFDIRAYEKVGITAKENEDEEEYEIQPMGGNLWMIQGKREKEIGPTKLEQIVSEVDKNNPPYGYILAASVNFSKKSYDVFREELRKKGVMEFYLWGRAELEDMLHFPKNDRILFTYFGISPLTKRRSRTTEVHAGIIIKNKLFKSVGEGENLQQPVFIRDLNDTHYPYKDKYKDFKEFPRWGEYLAVGHGTLGLWCESHEYYAYLDLKKKQWDFTKEVDIFFKTKDDKEDQKDKSAKRQLVADTWDFFPTACKAYLHVEGLDHYSDICLVDDKGDILYDMPHIYIDYKAEKGPFTRYFYFFKIGERRIMLKDEFEKIKVFPKKFQKSEFGKIYKNKKITLNPESLEEFKSFRMNEIIQYDKKYDFLRPKDVISIANTKDEKQYHKPEDTLIQITYIYKTKIKEFLENMGYEKRRILQCQLGGEFNENEKINIYEFRRVYRNQFEKNN